MASVIPSHLETTVVEGRGDESTAMQLRLTQIEAIEAQTAVLERIAAALERITPSEGRDYGREIDGLVSLIDERLGDRNFEHVFREDVRGRS